MATPASRVKESSLTRSSSCQQARATSRHAGWPPDPTRHRSTPSSWAAQRRSSGRKHAAPTRASPSSRWRRTRQPWPAQIQPSVRYSPRLTRCVWSVPGNAKRHPTTSPTPSPRWAPSRDERSQQGPSHMTSRTSSPWRLEPTTWSRRWTPPLYPPVPVRTRADPLSLQHGRDLLEGTCLDRPTDARRVPYVERSEGRKKRPVSVRV